MTSEKFREETDENIGQLIEQLSLERDAAAMHILKCENVLKKWLDVMVSGGDEKSTSEGISEALRMTTEVLGHGL